MVCRLARLWMASFRSKMGALSALARCAQHALPAIYSAFCTRLARTAPSRRRTPHTSTHTERLRLRCARKRASHRWRTPRFSRAYAASAVSIWHVDLPRRRARLRALSAPYVLAAHSARGWARRYAHLRTLRTVFAAAPFAVLRLFFRVRAAHRPHRRLGSASHSLRHHHRAASILFHLYGKCWRAHGIVTFSARHEPPSLRARPSLVAALRAAVCAPL